MLKQLLAFSLFSALFFLQCSQSTQPPKTGDTRELYSVYLTGKVLNKDGSPVASAQVSLIQYNLTAVTNGEGVYLLTELITSSAAAFAKDLDKDTLKVKKDSQEVTSREITQFIDTLPDIYLIQRDIYGSIANSITNFSKVEAVIKEANDSIPKVVGLWFNQGVNEYSGFVYFVYTGDLHNYAVYVNLYSVDSLLIGRSETISFPSTAGNIHMPDINPLNAIPIANAGADTVVSINDTILLHGTGRDIFDSSAIRLEWDAGAKGTFVETTTGYMLVIAPSLADSNFRCVLKVTDKDSNKVMDTVVVNVLQDMPQVSIQGNSTVHINRDITLSVQVNQRFGSIVKYRWDNGEESGWDDSSGTVFSCKYLAEKTCTVKVEATDDDGNIGTVSKFITVTNDAPVILGLRDTTISINDTINFNIIATDSDGVMQKYYWSFHGDGRNQYDSTTSGSVMHAYPSTEVICTVAIAVADSFGKISSKTSIVNVLIDSPEAEAGNDTVVGRGDTIHLHGSKSIDKYGRIIKYEWDIGNAGVFALCAVGDTDILAPDSLFYDYVCILRVTDDDGNSSLDTQVNHVGVMWHQATSAAPFLRREKHASVVFNNKIWVIGGYSDTSTSGYGQYLNDVWSSSDGQTWNCVTPSANFGPRAYANAIVFDDKLWIVGGYPSGGIWNSSDGATWTNVNSNVNIPVNGNTSAVVVFNNKIYAIGAFSSSDHVKDVWCSDDGATWQRLNSNFDFARTDGYKTEIFDNKIWVLGGWTPGYGTTGLDDVLWSSDGITWTYTTEASCLVRQQHASAVINNKMMVIGGALWDASSLNNEIWYTTTGTNWIKANTMGTFPARADMSAIVFNNMLWICGGWLWPGTTGQNDVWYLK